MGLGIRTYDVTETLPVWLHYKAAVLCSVSWTTTTTMLVSRTILSSVRTRCIGRLAATASTASRGPFLVQKNLLEDSFGGIRGPFRLNVRAVASSVANRPASSSIPHAAQNIKEEMGHTLEDMAQAIAGGKQPPQLGSPSKDAVSCP